MLRRIRQILYGNSTSGKGDRSEKGVSIPADESHMCPVLVARQPVFDRKSNIWGFELLFRQHEEAKEANVVDSNVATSSVISDGFSLVESGLAAGQKVLINFPSDLLKEEIPKVLPAETCAVEILEDVVPTREIFQALLQLKQDGYLIAVDDYVGQPSLAVFLKIADIVKVDVLGRSMADIVADVKTLQQYPALLLAEKVETFAMFEACQKMGFSLFQGFFFSRPEIIKGKKLSPSQTVKMRLLSQLADEEFDVHEVASIVRADVSLVYKLMRYMNSVHFALSAKISSVEHSISLLGRRKLMQWLCVTVLSELDSSPMAKHIVSQSAQRGKFLEILGSANRTKGNLAPESLFLLGLFSMLDTLLAIPKEDLLGEMPLDEDLIGALMGEKTPYTPWLKFLYHYERGEWDITLRIMHYLGLVEHRVSSAYEESITWANMFFV